MSPPESIGINEDEDDEPASQYYPTTTLTDGDLSPPEEGEDRVRGRMEELASDNEYEGEAEAELEADDTETEIKTPYLKNLLAKVKDKRMVKNWFKRNRSEADTFEVVETLEYIPFDFASESGGDLK